ncbi:ankyrin repeat domain-containing protein [Wolbachia pipientis]|uniref:Ankyrin repeat domain-containing protein n=1 Tax=Wolbachia pipientis TaxID=955 RepID=A0A7G5C9S9_WOLPI|nr:ankyrin repeat domain-containing protein [Wolbachia pipientis]QMV45963.1 ankyrin repeat domain-containing protein [Wolbachia pipientis]
MGIDLSALATDEQLYCIIERKVKKEEHKREKPRSRDGALKKCERLFEEGASSKVLTKLEESLREQEKYYRYYVQCFLPVLDEVIERSKKTPNETKEQVKQAISEITYNSKYCFTHNQNDRRNSEDSEAESGYGSDVEDDHKVEISNEITNNNTLLLKAIKNGNNRKFKKYLKDCKHISGIKDEKGGNILHLIASLEKKQKLKFLNIFIKIATEKNLVQLVDSENQEGKTPFQVALIDKITKEKHESHTIQDNDNTLKFLTKLLEHGASSDQLSLPAKDLEKLSEEQNKYYCKFLEKLAERKPETKTKVKEVIAHTINTPDSDDHYQLHLAIKNNDKELFEKLVQKGADISLKDGEGNNALHLIVTKLEREQRLKFLSISLEVDQKEQFIKAVNDKNDNEQTPLHRLLQHIKEKNEDRSCTDRKFEKTKRYKTLELLLKNGADITVQDKDEKNALHYIALFKGEQKVTCLELILGLVKNGTISKDKLGKAINAKNGEGNTPLELALKKKAEKRSIEYLPQGTIFNTATAYDNTTKFCTMLLEIGADPCSLELKDPKFHTKKYYLTLRDLKDYSGTPQKAQEKAKELKEKLEEKYHCKTASKKCKSGIKEAGSGIKKGVSAVAGFIDPAKRTRELLAITITITVIAMVTFAFFQGQMAIGAAIPIIAVAGVICLTLTLGFSGIKKLFEKSTNKAQDTFNDKNRSNSTTEQNQASKNLVNNDQQNLRNETKNQAVQESPNQSEHTENPATKMSDVSILRQFMNKLDGLTNKSSSLAL